MDSLQPNTALLPPALRALALSLLIEAVVPVLNKLPEGNPVPPGHKPRLPRRRRAFITVISREHIALKRSRIF